VEVRLATWYLDRFGPSTPRSRRWISDLRLELDNLRFLAAGLGPTHAEMAQRLAVTVAYFHKATGAVSVGIEESIAWLNQLDTATPERVALLCRLSSASLDSGDVDGAARVADQAVVMGADVGLPGGTAFASSSRLPASPAHEATYMSPSTSPAKPCSATSALMNGHRCSTSSR